MYLYSVNVLSPQLESYILITLPPPLSSFCRCLRIFPSWMSNLRDEQSESRWLISPRVGSRDSDRGEEEGGGHRGDTQPVSTQSGHDWNLYRFEHLKGSLSLHISIFMDGQSEIHAAGSRSGLGQSRIIFPLFLEPGSAGESRSR